MVHVHERKPQRNSRRGRQNPTVQRTLKVKSEREGKLGGEGGAVSPCDWSAGNRVVRVSRESRSESPRHIRGKLLIEKNEIPKGHTWSPLSNSRSRKPPAPSLSLSLSLTNYFAASLHHTTSDPTVSPDPPSIGAR